MAYQRDIGKFSYITLEGLDAKRYTTSDVERLKATWETGLSSLYGVKLQKSPGYKTKADGTIDEQYIIDENGLRDYLKSNIQYYLLILVAVQKVVYILLQVFFVYLNQNCHSL